MKTNQMYLERITVFGSVTFKWEQNAKFKNLKIANFAPP